MPVDKFNNHLDPESAIGAGFIERTRHFTIYGTAKGLVQDIESDLSASPTPLAIPAFAGESLEIVGDAGSVDVGQITILALGPGATLIDPIQVTLNGTTPVALTGLISRINFAFASDDAGIATDVLIRPAGGGATFALVESLRQQTAQALYTVPAGSRWTIGNLVGTMEKSLGTDTDVLFSFLFKPSTAAQWFRPLEFGLQRDGATNIVLDNKHPIAVLGPTDIKLAATASATGADVAGFASGLIFD